jgi:hypothetical protein
VTYGIAKATVKQIMNRVWIEDISENILDVVILEQSAIIS